MGHLNYMISDLALITVVAGATTLLFKKIKLPVVLGYILAGFLISPHFVWLPTIIGVENINTWANIGIVFLMFALGLEFSFKKIADVGVSAIVTSITVMGAMITIGYVVGNLLGWGRMDSMFLGGMLSMSSTMIILKAFEEYNLKEEKFGKLVLGTLVIEDIGGIFMMIILSTISVSQNVEGMKLVADIGMLLLMLVIWLVLGIFLIPTFLKKVSSLMNQETLLIVALAICFGMVIISNLIGFSEALGAFMAGSILAGTVKGERIEHLIQPLKDFFGAIFFVSVGMLVVPEMLVNYAMPIVILTIVTILGQMIFSTLGMLLSGQSLHTAIRGGSSMVQIGEFSFIVATLGLNLGVTSEFLYPIIVCVAVITTFYTPLSIKSSEGLYQFISARLPNRWLAFLRQYTSEKRSNSDRGGEWKKFITRYFLRTVITSAALFLIYSAGNYCKDIVGPWAAAIGTCILMIPVINLMQNNRSNAFKKLWLKSTTNRLPLLALRVFRLLIALFFLVLTWRKFIGAPYLLLIVLGIILIILAIRSTFLRSHAIKLEARFVANFNERILHKKKEEEEDVWMGDKVYIVEFRLDDAGQCRTVASLLNERVLDVLVIKILRKERHINIPGPHEMVCSGDLVTVVSSKGQLEAYLIALENAEYIETPKEPMVTLREYMYSQIDREIPPEEQIMCCAIPISKGSGLHRKTIRNSGFRAKYEGFIVGIERDNYPIIDPPLNMIMEDGDLVWAIGTQGMAQRLLKDDLLQE